MKTATIRIIEFSNGTRQLATDSREASFDGRYELDEFNHRKAAHDARVAMLTRGQALKTAHHIYRRLA